MHNQRTNQIMIFHGPAINILERMTSASLDMFQSTLSLTKPKELSQFGLSPVLLFSMKFDVKDRNKAIFETQKAIADLKLCYDGSKQDNART